MVFARAFFCFFVRGILALGRCGASVTYSSLLNSNGKKKAAKLFFFISVGLLDFTKG